jgi:hypothetical protein
MRLGLLGMVLVTGCGSCAPMVVRDRVTYRAELDFTDRMLREGAPAVRDFVVSQCTCTDNVWRARGDGATNQQCAIYADWWVVYMARWAWHRSMMLYNARLLELRPPAAPRIPPVTCDLPRRTP